MSIQDNFSTNPTMFFTISESYSGVNINFSASFQVTKSITWGISTQSITQFNSINLMGSPVTGSNVLKLINVLSQSGADIQSASNATLTTFLSNVSSSGVSGFFLVSSSIRLL